MFNKTLRKVKGVKNSSFHKYKIITHIHCVSAILVLSVKLSVSDVTCVKDDDAGANVTSPLSKHPSQPCSRFLLGSLLQIQSTMASSTPPLAATFLGWRIRFTSQHHSRTFVLPNASYVISKSTSLGVWRVT